MSQAEALQEARRRWGSSAEVKSYKRGFSVDTTHEVGVYRHKFGNGYEAKGVGASWEEAFADADRKDGGE